jgi:hypothetical protein
VEINLIYSEVYAPIAAFWSNVYQIVVLDQNVETVLIGLESKNLVLEFAAVSFWVCVFGNFWESAFW